jgi:hypothetical protein
MRDGRFAIHSKHRVGPSRAGHPAVENLQQVGKQYYGKRTRPSRTPQTTDCNSALTSSQDPPLVQRRNGGND